jgi:DNA end-binding protein Ku
VLAAAGTVGIGRMILRNREHIVGIKSYQNGIILFTLRYADEIVDITQVIPAELPEPTEGERKLAKTLLEEMSSTLNLSEYKDHYRKAVEELVEKKLKDNSHNRENDVGKPPKTYCTRWKKTEG